MHFHELGALTRLLRGFCIREVDVQGFFSALSPLCITHESTKGDVFWKSSSCGTSDLSTGRMKSIERYGFGANKTSTVSMLPCV